MYTVIMDDRRNVTDEFKGMKHEAIVEQLDKRGVDLEIAIENYERDFNMGTIVRSANAFGVRTVHIIGRRQWNKRGAMMTDKYLEVVYHSDIETFKKHIDGRPLIAIENNVESQSVLNLVLPDDVILLFGSESSGLSSKALTAADQVCHIPQLGSTRSLNVGVAAGVVMWEWSRSRI